MYEGLSRNLRKRKTMTVQVYDPDGESPCVLLPAVSLSQSKCSADMLFRSFVLSQTPLQHAHPKCSLSIARKAVISRSSPIPLLARQKKVKLPARASWGTTNSAFLIPCATDCGHFSSGCRRRSRPRMTQGAGLPSAEHLISDRDLTEPRPGVMATFRGESAKEGAVNVTKTCETVKERYKII